MVHGLVLARIQASKGGPHIYSQRCCPVSYGIVCRQRYDPQIHQGEDLIKDPYSKGHWAENQITWIVRQVSSPGFCVTCRPESSTMLGAYSATCAAAGISNVQTLLLSFERMRFSRRS